MEIKKLIQFLNHMANPDIVDIRKEVVKMGGFENCLNNYYKEV